MESADYWFPLRKLTIRSILTSAQYFVEWYLQLCSARNNMKCSTEQKVCYVCTIIICKCEWQSFNISQQILCNSKSAFKRSQSQSSGIHQYNGITVRWKLNLKKYTSWKKAWWRQARNRCYVSWLFSVECLEVQSTLQQNSYSYYPTKWHLYSLLPSVWGVRVGYHREYQESLFSFLVDLLTFYWGLHWWDM